MELGPEGAGSPATPAVGPEPAVPVLGTDLAFDELYSREGALRLDAAFLAYLGAGAEELRGALLAARSAPSTLEAKAESELLIALAPHLEDFLGTVFGIGGELAALRQQHQRLAPLYTVKRLFIQRRALKAYAEAAEFDGEALREALEAALDGPFSELLFAERVTEWQKDDQANSKAIDLALRFAAWASLAPEAHDLRKHGVLFRHPHKTDAAHLVPVATEMHGDVACLVLPQEERRQRAGFALTDRGTDLTGALDHANYCIWCHNQGKDSCSKGLREKSGAFKPNAFGAQLTGCPLEERISEMNLLKAEGHPLGALATVVVDNPMCAATGHRICNDCMKACIFQKQDPVDIPQVETRVLKDVLALPFGFEIYSLLTRWNPLNLRRPVPKAPSGRTVLVVGLGPAGFTLSHHLMNDGHTVVAVDGLKIEPLAPGLSGVAADGTRVGFAPVRRIEDLREPLDDRAMAGFGGVAEYGITVRWDKNFLKIVRLLLERRQAFQMFGGVRFGGTLTVEQAFALGFDHIALCAGAGKPTIVPMKNGLAPGVRQASDFLMALQLTGAAKSDSIANLQVRLPVVVIGGGLTGIDTATEALAYYAVEVEKFLARFETLAAEQGADAVRTGWREAERELAEEWLDHARALRHERAEATREGREPRLRQLLESWGGATLAYRRRLLDAPSYTANHEEVAKALEEGIRFVENFTPGEVKLDRFGQAAALVGKVTATDVAGNATTLEVTLPARTILVAAGTQPNTVLNREDPTAVLLDGRYFRAIDEAGNAASPEKSAKPREARVLTSLRPDGRAISFFGDLHPSFAGNVVKAMASALRGYPVVSRALEQLPAPKGDPAALLARLNRSLHPRVKDVVRLAPNIVEVVVEAPLAAAAFQPGQFFRLQNYEALAPKADGTRLAMEGLALTGASVDRKAGLLSLIVLEMGGSSDLTADLKPGEPVVLMGPSGAPTEIPRGETVLLVGGGLGNAVLFSIGQAMRAAGCRVLYFAGYRQPVDRYKVAELERAADTIVWCCDQAPGFTPGRAGDMTFVGNIVQALSAYAEGALGPQPIALFAVDRVIAIGSDGMMAAVAAARHGVLAGKLKPDHIGIASVNAPMQCMMKEICAQCLQRHVDPASGVETIVFACANQDQDLDTLDFPSLRARLGQNSLQEKLTHQWVRRARRHLGTG
ncbi:MAG: FAD-dependent oxidoreductase [Bauldia sp.]